MKHSLLIVSLFISFTIFAQRPGGYGGYGKAPSIKGKIAGKIIDKDTGEPVSYASVVIKKGDKQINGTITDDKGEFKMVDINVDNYTLLISFIGYETITMPIEMTKKKPDVDFDKISMASSSTQLDEVVVEGEKAIVENRIDKIVYNAENDVANAGGDGTDVLRRAPLLSVDAEGGVSLRGSQNVQILINGKPSTIFAASPGDALQAIPADNIKSVEVITNPSAKYDGEGSAGIVNIITKKSTPEGFSGNFNGSVGNLSNRGVLSINAGRGRFGFSGSGSVFYSPTRDGTFDFFREDRVNDQSRVLTENGDNFSDRLGFFSTASAYYDFNAFHSLSTSFRIRGFGSERENRVAGAFDDPINNISQRYRRSTTTDNLFSGYEWSLDYIYKFPEKDGQEFSASYKIDGNIQDQEFIIRQADVEGNDMSLFQDQRNINDGNNRENTIQMDYAHPFSKNFKLEVGAKTILRNVVSDFEFDTLNTATNNYDVDPNRTDVFDYVQNVYSGYVSTNIKFGKKYGIIAGVRYEETEIEGEFDVQESPFSNTYSNWLPSVTISRNLGKGKTLKTAFSRRIQRPGLRVINPYIQLNNNRSQTFGNPELDPEVTDQYEVSYGTFAKGLSINASLFYRRTTEIIESFVTIDNEGLATTTFRNIGTNNSYGVNLFSSITLFKIATLRGGLNVYTYNGEGVINGQQLERSAVIWDGNMSANVKLKRDWTIDLFGFYRAPNQTLQGTTPTFSIFVVGARKEISEKLSLGVRIVEPFFKFKNFGSDLSGENFTQVVDTDILFRSYGINVRYKFGKLDFKQRTRRSKIRNEDQSSDDSGNQNF